MPDGFGECSIGGVPFGVSESAPGFFPLPTREAIENITHIPYSNLNIVDHGGFGPWNFAARVKVLVDDELDFENMNGTLGALILYGIARGTGKMKITSSAVYAGMTFYIHEIEIIY